MATEKETIILDFQIEQGDAISELEKTKKSIIQLKQEQKELNDAYKKGNVTLDEYASEQVRLEGILKKQQNAYNNVQKSVTGVKTQFDKLIDTNKGIQKSLEGTTGSLAALVPGFSGAAAGVQSVTTASKAFIATPIGAVVGALALAFGALVTYIKGSDEAGDRFAKTTAALGFVFEKLKIIVENVGGFIFDTIEFIAGGVEKIIAYVSPAAGAAIEAAKRAGEELANIQDDIENRENDFILKRAQVNEKVQALREKAITQEGAAKRKTIQEAIDLEKSLAAEETKLAEQRLQAFQLENKERIANGKLTSDQLKELKTLEADIVNQRSAGAQATIKFQKEIERINDEEIKKLKEKNEQLAIEKQRKEDLGDVRARVDGMEIQMLDESTEKIKIKSEIDLAATQKGLDAKIKAGQKEAEQRNKNTQLEILANQQKLSNANTVLSQVKGLINEETSAYKALAVAQATIDTYRGATAALAPPPIGAGPLFGPILAATTIALGLANVAKIVGLSAAAGGGNFMTKGPTLLMVGDNPGGVERVSVEPISGRGKTTVNGNLVKMAGGGVLETQSITGPINQAFAFKSMQNKQPQVVASWKEATELSERISFKEALVTA